jgi:hypothetical protein
LRVFHLFLSDFLQILGDFQPHPIVFYLNTCKIEKIILIKNSVEVNLMNELIFLNIRDLKFKNPVITYQKNCSNYLY